MDIDDKEDVKLHNEFRVEIFRCQLSNSQILDKSILSLSSAGLGLSLLFIKSVVPMETAIHLGLLHWSWIMFILAIMSTLVSFPISQKALDNQLEIDYKYRILKNEDAIDKENRRDKITGLLSLLSIIFYSVAVIFMVLFIKYNLQASVNNKLPIF